MRAKRNCGRRLEVRGPSNLLACLTKCNENGRTVVLNGAYSPLGALVKVQL